MAALYLVQEIDQETHCIYTLYRLTSLKEAPVKVAQKGGFSVWPEDRTQSPIEWAQEEVYNIVGDDIVNMDLVIKEF